MVLSSLSLYMCPYWHAVRVLDVAAQHSAEHQSYRCIFANEERSTRWRGRAIDGFVVLDRSYLQTCFSTSRPRKGAHVPQGNARVRGRNVPLIVTTVIAALTDSDVLARRVAYEERS